MELLERPSGDRADGGPKATAVDISVLVVLTERPEPLAELLHEFAAPLRASGRSFEFVVVAESRFRALTEPLLEQARAGAPIRVLEVGYAAGEAALLKAAVEHCRGSLLLTLPAYPRIEAEAILPMIERVAGGVDVVVARRWPRRDSWINRVQNRVLHALVQSTVGGGFHDLGCGVRAMRRDVLRDLPLYGDFSRFLPLIAQREGYTVEELSVSQHAGDLGRRVYSPGIYVRRLIDLVGIFFLMRFREKPLRFFGLLGSSLAATGAALLAVLVAQRIGGQPLTDRPLLLLAVLVLVLGVQLIGLGLVGEIIVHLNARRKPRYRLRAAEMSRS